MAKSGSFLTNGWYSSSKGDYIYLEFSWTASQSVVGNTSTISWTLKGKRSASGYVNAGGFKVVIDGETVYEKSTDYRIELRDGTPIASGSKTLTHKPDGTRSFAVSIAGGIYTYAVNCTGSKTFDLDTIPRKATITAASDFTDTGNPSISFSNPGGFTMDVWLEPNPVGDHLCVRTGIPNTGSYTWSLTDEEREALRSKCPGNSCTIRLGLYTYIGGVQHADYKDKTYTMTETAATQPSVSMEIKLNNGDLPSDFDDMYIQGVSKVDVTLSADGKYGSDITSYYATVDGKTYYSKSFTSDVIQSDQMVEIVGYAKDAREFTGFIRDRIDVIAYSKPSVTTIAYRCNSSGDEDPEGAYMKVGFTATITSLNGKNSASYIIDYGGTPISGAGTSYISDPIACDVSRVWSVEVKVSDEIDTTTKAAVIPIAFTMMDFYRTGMGVSLGKVATRDGFDCAMPAYFTGGVYIDEFQLDHIVEEGTDGIWTYRKWNSGIAECRGIFVQENVAVETAWGNLFESPGYVVDLPGNLFVETPQFSITLTGGGGAMLETYSKGSATQSPHMCVVRAFAATIDTVNTSIVAYGRWK